MRGIFLSISFLISAPSLLSAESKMSQSCNEANFFQKDKQVCAFERELDFYEEQTQIEIEKSIPFNGLKKSGRSLVFPKAFKKSGYSDSIEGPIYRSSNPFDGYDYYRYVSYYNIRKVEKRISELPSVFEECHDSHRFSSYSQSIGVNAMIEASIGIAPLGLKGRIGVDKTVSVSRNLSGRSGQEAIHTPYMLSERWLGKIYIQTYTVRGNKTALKNIPAPRFDVRDINSILRVKRERVTRCN